MTERPPVGSGPSVAAVEDSLLATKLHIPTPPAGRVARPRLTEMLNDAKRSGLALICAPAGYGKTVLLAEWARGGERNAAWLSLDDGDNDPSRFWRHVLAAVDRVRPGTADRFDAAGPAAFGSFETPATALINELAAESPGTEVRLVLDDYHLIDAPAVHQLVDFLLEHRPPNLRLVVASRADPPLALARLRARGELSEIRLAQLRFTTDEAAALLRLAAAPSPGAIPATALDALTTRTEGWAAGLQLAALSLRGHPDAAGFIATFTGSHRHVLDYLSEEVLERQPDDVRTFLIDTAVLDRLSGPLCDAVTGRTDSQAMLEYLERTGLFVIPLDETRGWWRYHHLFADLLRGRLQRDRGRTTTLHRAAAGWYEHQGLVDEAIHHSFAAGDTLAATRLVEAHFDTVFNLRGEEATIHRWLRALPDDLMRARPRLLLARAQMAAMRGDIETMEPLIDAAEGIPGAATDEPFEPTSGKQRSLLVNVPAVIALQRSYLAQLRGDADGTIRYARQAQDLVDDDEPTLGAAVQGFIAMDDWLRGRLEQAERSFASVLPAWQATGVPTTTSWAYYMLGRIQRAEGRLAASEQTCRRALQHLAGSDGRPIPGAGPAFVGLADVAYQRNDLAAALGHLSAGIPLCRRFVHTPPLAAGLVTLAWIRHVTGEPDAARAALDEAMGLALGPAGLLNPVPAELAKLQLAQGDLPAAAHWLEQSGVGEPDEPSYASESAHLVLARVLMAQGRPAAALELLDRLHAAAIGQHRARSMIETSGLRAMALDAVGRSDAALEALAEALTAGMAEGYLRVFADEGHAMSALVGRLVAARRSGRLGKRIQSSYLARLQRAFLAQAPDAAAEHTPPFDPLTARESEILELMARGKSNLAIATELVVSLDTVKKHVSHILDKLGARNRTEAVARGRELGLSG